MAKYILESLGHRGALEVYMYMTRAHIRAPTCIHKEIENRKCFESPYEDHCNFLEG